MIDRSTIHTTSHQFRVESSMLKVAQATQGQLAAISSELRAYLDQRKVGHKVKKAYLGSLRLFLQVETND